MADYFYTLYSIMIDPINSLMRTILTKLEKPSDQGQIDRYVGGISLLQSQNGHTYQDNPFNILLLISLNSFEVKLLFMYVELIP